MSESLKNGGAFYIWHSSKEQMAFEKRAVISSEMKNSMKVYPLNYFAAFDYDSEEHQRELNVIVQDGLQQFEKLFGFQSVSIVPCCGICGNEFWFTILRAVILLILLLWLGV